MSLTTALATKATTANSASPTAPAIHLNPMDARGFEAEGTSGEPFMTMSSNVEPKRATR